MPNHRPHLDPDSCLEVLIVHGKARQVEEFAGRLIGLKGVQQFLDKGRNELFDIPDALRPDADMPAPPRFLPVFDNVLLSYTDRRRILSEAHRKALFGTAALLEGTVVIDGYVGAKWKIVRERGRSVQTVEPFARLRNRDRAAVSDEGARLLAFALGLTGDRDIRFTKSMG